MHSTQSHALTSSPQRHTEPRVNLHTSTPLRSAPLRSAPRRAALEKPPYLSVAGKPLYIRVVAKPPYLRTAPANLQSYLGTHT